MVLSASIPNPSSGQLVVSDDTQALIAAIAAIQANSNVGGSVSITSPDALNVATPSYIFSYPLSVPEGISLNVQTECLLYETWTLAGINTITTSQPPTNPVAPQFGIGAYAYLNAYGANPVIYTPGSFNMTDIGVQLRFNSQGGPVQGGGNYPYGENVNFKNCYFIASSGTTNLTNAVGVVLNSSGLVSFEDCQFSGYSVLGGTQVAGNCTLLPYFPSLLIHWSDQTSNGCSLIQMYGNCSFDNRAIVMDQKEFTSDSTCIFDCGRTGGGIEFQNSGAPSLMVWGANYKQIYMGG